ncbi:dehydrogenase with different specificitie [Purpureocillium lavendulum]|uniref:Dehydrogenase with different specificitie n=1 Tax=Purpureocillium lavendulum TaxID=1247861 RepID=A0AB34FWS9_9HYPO|nr:dehydrogenase with different specificitie [Purpureocillium lavendulum]
MTRAYDSDDSMSSVSDEVRMNIAYPAPSDPSYPRFPPPPTASVCDAKKDSQRPRPLEKLLPVPAAPALVVTGLGIQSPLSKIKSKRKTILERIEGWWDLGLLEKRQTLFGGGAVAKPAASR